MFIFPFFLKTEPKLRLCLEQECAHENIYLVSLIMVGDFVTDFWPVRCKEKLLGGVW